MMREISIDKGSIAGYIVLIRETSIIKRTSISGTPRIEERISNGQRTNPAAISEKEGKE